MWKGHNAMAKKKQYTYVCARCQQIFITTKNPSRTKTEWCHSCALHRGMSTLERFWRWVDKETVCECHDWENRCWPWTGPRNKVTRYGIFGINQKHISAHV